MLFQYGFRSRLLRARKKHTCSSLEFHGNDIGTVAIPVKALGGWFLWRRRGKLISKQNIPSQPGKKARRKTCGNRQDWKRNFTVKVNNCFLPHTTSLSCSTREAIYVLCEALESKSKMNLRLCIRFVRYLLVRGRFCLTFRNLPELIRRPTKYRGDWKQQSCVFQICQFLFPTPPLNEFRSGSRSKRLDTCQIVSKMQSAASKIFAKMKGFGFFILKSVSKNDMGSTKCLASRQCCWVIWSDRLEFGTSVASIRYMATDCLTQYFW